jgi:hypothetical protein
MGRCVERSASRNHRRFKPMTDAMISKRVRAEVSGVGCASQASAARTDDPLPLDVGLAISEEVRDFAERCNAWRLLADIGRAQWLSLRMCQAQQQIWTLVVHMDESSTLSCSSDCGEFLFAWHYEKGGEPPPAEVTLTVTRGLLRLRTEKSL